MTLALDPASILRRESPNDSRACLRGVGTAVPEMCWTRADLVEEAARLWQLDAPARTRWERINRGTGIERRYAAVDARIVLPLSTGSRMELYRQHAPTLATTAARRALLESDVQPRDVTDLIVVSCTGFGAPGVDVDLVERLDLPPSTRRSVIGFMGCFGAISGLRAAAALANADSRAVVLVVCVELCSLHLPPAPDAQAMVATALFSDGAAAAVVTGEDAERRGAGGGATWGEVGLGRSLLIPEGRDWMTWLVTDAGFAMTLAKEVPRALRARLAGFIDGAGDARPRTFIVHPGGPGILDATSEALGLAEGSGLELSRDVLRRCGNMSSATVLFVLAEARQAGRPLPMLLLAFGPGLTIESLPLGEGPELPEAPRPPDSDIR